MNLDQYIYQAYVRSFILEKGFQKLFLICIYIGQAYDQKKP